MHWYIKPSIVPIQPRDSKKTMQNCQEKPETKQDKTKISFHINYSTRKDMKKHLK